MNLHVQREMAWWIQGNAHPTCQLSMSSGAHGALYMCKDRWLGGL